MGNKHTWIETRKEVYVNRKIGKEERIYFEKRNSFISQIKSISLKEIISFLIGIGAIISPIITYYIAKENLKLSHDSLKISEKNNKNSIEAMEKLSKDRFIYEKELSKMEKQMEIEKEMSLQLYTNVYSLNKEIEQLLLSESDSIYNRHYFRVINEIIPNIIYYSKGKNRNKLKNIDVSLRQISELNDLIILVNEFKNYVENIRNLISPDGQPYTRGAYFYQQAKELGGTKLLGYNLSIDINEWIELTNDINTIISKISSNISKLNKTIRTQNKISNLNELYNKISDFSEKSVFYKYNNENPFYAKIPSQYSPYRDAKIYIMKNISVTFNPNYNAYDDLKYLDNIIKISEEVITRELSSYISTNKKNIFSIKEEILADFQF